MTCRAWRGRTTKQNAGAYQSAVRGEEIPGMGSSVPTLMLLMLALGFAHEVRLSLPGW
jgi:hypothetical protein